MKISKVKKEMLVVVNDLPDTQVYKIADIDNDAVELEYESETGKKCYGGWVHHCIIQEPTPIQLGNNIRLENIGRYYGQEFQIHPNMPYPTKAQIWESIEECKSQYEKFLADCDKFDQIPLATWIFVGTPDGDEDIYGYPDYPDYLILPDSKDPLKAFVRKLP